MEFGRLCFQIAYEQSIDKVLSSLATGRQSLKLATNIQVEDFHVGSFKSIHVGVEASQIVASVCRRSASVGLGVHRQFLEVQEATFDVPGDTGHVEWTVGLHEFCSGAVDRLGKTVEQLVVILRRTQASVNESVKWYIRCALRVIKTAR
jgi:hypothetical protein